MRRILSMFFCFLALHSLGQEVISDSTVVIDSTDIGMPAIPIDLEEINDQGKIQSKFGLRFGVSKTQINTASGDVVRVGTNGTPLIENGAVVRDELVSNSAFGNGFQAAFFARFEKGTFYLQPEVIYASKGGKFDFLDRNGNLLNRVDAKFSAIDVPVLLGIRFRDARVFGGPVISYALSKNEEFIKALEPYTGDDFDNSFFNRPIVNTVFGLGFEFKTFFFDARYEGGITNYGSSIIGPANSPKEFFFGSNQFILSVGLIK